MAWTSAYGLEDEGHSMRGHDDDIGGLFKSFGAQEGSFKELSRQSETRDAEDRWPLFKAIPVEKRAQPPALSASQKDQWKMQAAPPPQPDAPLLAAEPSLGKQLASGLSLFTKRFKPAHAATAATIAKLTPAVPESPPLLPALKPARRSTPAAAAAPPAIVRAPQPPAPAARSLFGKSGPPAAKPATEPAASPKQHSLNAIFAPPPAAQATRAAPAKSGGLFARTAPPPSANTAQATGSLSNLFERLEDAAAPALETKNRYKIINRLGKF
jgi:hypothetical protein